MEALFGGSMLRASVVATLLSVLGLVSATKAHAQSLLPTEEFDVVSIRPNNNVQGSSLVQAVPGNLTMSRISLQRLLVIAYGLKDYQLVGEPSWSVSKRYDLIAKASADSSVEKMEGVMLQALLEDRFKIKFHRETRMLPLYEMVLAKGGSKLRHSEPGSCTPYVKTSRPAIAPAPGELQPHYCGFHRTGSGVKPILDGEGVSVADLAANVARSYNTSLGRDVVDKSGLSGTFDIHLTWTNESASVEAASSQAGDDPSIFVALQEQLGLKLKAGKGSVEVFVIDHIEEPSAN